MILYLTVFFLVGMGNGAFLYWALLRWRALDTKLAELEVKEEPVCEPIVVLRPVELQVQKPPKGAHAVKVAPDTWIYPN